MKPSPRVVVSKIFSVLSVGLIAPVMIWGANAFALLQLKTGKVYHNVRVVNNGPTVLNISSDEGLFQIKKSDLPDEVSKQYPVDPSAAELEKNTHEEEMRNAKQYQQERMEKIAADQKAKMAEREKRFLRNGCRILSFKQISNNVVLVEFRNETALPMKIDPQTIFADGDEGKVFDGAWVVRNADGRYRRTENSGHIAGNSTQKFLMIFTRLRGVTISDVYWADADLATQPVATGK